MEVKRQQGGTFYKRFLPVSYINQALATATAAASTTVIVAANDEESKNYEPNEIVTFKKIA